MEWLLCVTALGVHLRPLGYAAVVVQHLPETVVAAGEPMGGLGDGHDSPFPDAVTRRDRQSITMGLGKYWKVWG